MRILPATTTLQVAVFPEFLTSIVSFFLPGGSRSTDPMRPVVHFLPVVLNFTKHVIYLVVCSRGLVSDHVVVIRNVRIAKIKQDILV